MLSAAIFFSLQCSALSLLHMLSLFGCWESKMIYNDIQLNRMDEDRIFSLNLTLRTLVNIYESSEDYHIKNITRLINQYSLESLIKKQLPSNTEVFIYGVNVDKIHEVNKIEKVSNISLIMQYRITLKVETVVNYGGLR